MENEREKKYFIIWLYISILLHLFVVIIMLTIKPTTTPSTDPDPASSNFDTQVIFMQDSSATVLPVLDEPKPEESKQEYKIAARMQGGDISAQSSTTADKPEAVQDLPQAALSSEYKKGMHNQTKEEDQDLDGIVNILHNATIDQQESQLKETSHASDFAQSFVEHDQAPTKTTIDIPAPDTTNQAEQLQIDTASELRLLTESIESTEKRIAPAEIVKAVISENIHKNSEDTSTAPTQDLLQPLTQKVVSKKHRPADIGLENLSKVQLSKETQETTRAKKKMSLMDIQQGFSQFVKNSSNRQIATPTSATLGNSLFFSSTGNAQKDDELGLKLASYLHQTGKMYDSSCSLYSDMITKLLRQHGLPSENNTIIIKIERSGKISEIKTMQSCGNQAIDNYHIKIVESMGDLPPVPKYIETPLRVGAQFTFKR